MEIVFYSQEVINIIAFFFLSSVLPSVPKRDTFFTKRVKVRVIKEMVFKAVAWKYNMTLSDSFLPSPPLPFIFSGLGLFKPACSSAVISVVFDN